LNGVDTGKISGKSERTSIPNW